MWNANMIRSVYTYASWSVCEWLNPFEPPRNAFEALKRHLSENVWPRQGTCTLLAYPSRKGSGGGVYVCVAGAGGAGLKGLLAGVHMLIGKCTAERAPVEVSISALANFWIRYRLRKFFMHVHIYTIHTYIHTCLHTYAHTHVYLPV